MTHVDYEKANPILRTMLLDSVDSTMREAERQAAIGCPTPLLICARAQTGGTGRHGRHWASPPGNLYWTILLDDEADRPRDAGLAFAAGLAVMDALATIGLAPGRLGLKWPNDVLLDGSKVAGVLAQSSVTGTRAHTIVGIGINVASAPAETAYPATALVPHGLPVPDIAVLRDALTQSFLTRRSSWHTHGLQPLRADAASRLHGLGAPIRIALDRDRTDVVHGINEGLDPAGALLLRTPDGVRHTIIAGDVLA